MRDLTTFVPVGRVTLPFQGIPTRLVRWGVNGLAVRAISDQTTGTSGKLYIVQSALVSAAAPIPTGISLSASAVTVSESSSSVTLTVIRTGDLSVASTVNYATADGTASQRSDYTTALGTLQFAPGESTKTVQVLLTNDALPEANETFTLNLRSPVGAVITTPARITVTIGDDDPPTPLGNPVDTTDFFVRQHYHDFLNRNADFSGLQFWSNNINQCGSDANCATVQRINTSGAFFLSIEFQQTGYLVERMYKTAFGDANGPSMLGGTSHQLPVPIVRYFEFLQDTQRLGRGVVVLAPTWEQALENNKQAYAGEFVQTARFTTGFPNTMSPAQFVDKLNQNAGNVLSSSERAAAINLFGGANDSSNTTARAQALRQVAEDQDLFNSESNRAFVLAQYFGYLRRNPNDLPDSDYTGYEFWLNKLNQFNGDYIAAEMVKAYISSGEYRQRFGP